MIRILAPTLPSTLVLWAETTHLPEIELNTMLTIVRLEDGCYRVTVDYKSENGTAIHCEWTFTEAESDAKEELTVLSITFR